MKREEFFINLRESLATVPNKQAQKIIDFYSESIDDKIEDGMSEEEAIASFDPPEKIKEDVVKEIPFTTLVQNKFKASRNNSSNKTLWLILIILGSPLWLSLILALLCIVFSFYVLICSLIIALYAVVYSIGVSGGAIILSGIVGVVSTSGLPVTIALLGVGIAVVGVFVMLFRPCNYLAFAMVRGAGNLVKGIKNSIKIQEV